jgi:hypothetical protein
MQLFLKRGPAAGLRSSWAAAEPAAAEQGSAGWQDSWAGHAGDDSDDGANFGDDSAACEHTHTLTVLLLCFYHVARIAQFRICHATA